MRKYLLSLTLTLCLMSCNSQPKIAIDRQPTPHSPFLQSDFNHYIQDTTQWLAQHRDYISEDKALEIAVNSPFEKKPAKKAKQGVLLIHGLSDSPHSFIDVARHFSAQGILVRTVLLPGHGSKPADLILATADDWYSIVNHHTKLLAKEVDEVWLGGFSTGANLALIEAYDNPDVAGALLYSPAFESSIPFIFLAPYLKHLIEWADIDPERNITRYDSLPMNGAALYYQTAKKVQGLIKKNNFKKPVFFSLSESDSVIDTQKMVNYYTKYFKNPNNQLLWLGEQTFNQDNIVEYSMNIPEKRISNASHMSLLYKIDNPLYGENASIRICNNGQSKQNTEKCLAGEKTWYSAWGYKEKGKNHARLTWNPYFKEMMKLTLEVIHADKATHYAD